MSALESSTLAAAAAVLALAWRNRWLTGPGLLLAAGVGAAVWLGAGPPYVGLLIVFFATSSLLSRSLDAPAPPAPGSAPGESATWSGDPAGGTGRSATQVLANGGIAAAASLAGLAGLLSGAQFAVAGALAAAMADTWATEIGTAAAWSTRLVSTGEPVPPGRSGGVSWPGSGAALAASALLGSSAALLAGAPSVLTWLAILVPAGMSGMALDSILGATVEDRVTWIDNQVVNLFGSCAGALAGWAIARAMGLA